jgi:hypothetical protein
VIEAAHPRGLKMTDRKQIGDWVALGMSR